MSLLQLSRYSVTPSLSSTLLKLLEEGAREPESPRLVGTFRDLGDEDALVCLHAHVDAPRGPIVLQQLHRSVSAATAAYLDERLVLRAGWEESGLAPEIECSGATGRPHVGVVELCIVRTAAAVDAIDLMYFCDEVAPLIQAAGGTVLSCLVERTPAAPDTNEDTNEDGSALVWLAGFPGRSAYAPAMATGGWIAGAIAAWPGLRASPRVWQLQPTPHSTLTATSPSRFRPIYLLPHRMGRADPPVAPHPP